MGDILKFARAVVGHWGSLVTGGVAIGLVSIWQGVGHPISAWVYWLIATLGLVVAFYRAWLDKHEALNGQIRKVIHMEQEFLINQPVLALRVAYSKIEPSDSGDSIFRLQNCGTRTARWATVRSVKSLCGHYTLIFGEVPALSPGPSEGIPCQARFGIEPATIWKFLHDVNPDSALVWFDVTLECRDLNETLVETLVRICFDVESNALYATAVPYTLKKPVNSTVLS